MPKNENFESEIPKHEAEPEIKPEYSEETLNKLLQVDLMMEEDEKLLNGLGSVERKRIEDNKDDNKEAYKEIYARVEIGRVSLQGKQDIEMLELGGIGLKMRNMLRRIVSGGKRGSEYAMESDRRLKDKRKLLGLSDSYINAEHPLENIEIAAAAKELGLDIGEVLRRDLSKKYAKGEKGAKVEKIIMGQKTDQEKDKIAGDILERRLKDSEKIGAEMVKQKDSLAAMQRDMIEYDQDLGPATKENLKDQVKQIEGLRDEKKKELDNNLGPIRTPLENRQTELAAGMESLSDMSKELTFKEEECKKDIKSLDEKINRIKGSEKIKEFMGEEIGKWKAEKARLEANKQAFTDKKKDLEARAKALKNNKDEVDKTLARINKIGKTKEELKAEEAEKEKQKVSEKKPAKEKKPLENKNAESAESEKIDEETELERELYYKGKAINNANESDKPALQKQKDELQKVYEKIIKDKNNPNKTAETAEKKQEKESIKFYVSKWFNELGIDKNDKIARKYFKIEDQDFNMSISMNSPQAKAAYINYKIESLKIGKPAAKRLADYKFEEIIKNL